MTHDKRIVAALTALLALGGCTGVGEPEPPQESTSSPTASAPSSDLASFYRQEVRWTPCGGQFVCAQVKVPLDYTDPSASDIELSVVRLPASGDSRGSLVLNPGGPGASGVDYARAARAVVSPDVLKSYDIVGFDPRGVAGSAPVDCVDDAQLDSLFATDTTPDDQAEVDSLSAQSAAVGAGCEQRSAQLATHLDSVSVAKSESSCASSTQSTGALPATPRGSKPTMS